MSYIRYKNNNLFVESVSVRRLASKLSTPFYLYSEANIIENYKSFSSSFKKTKPLICFSVKANSNIVNLPVPSPLGVLQLRLTHSFFTHPLILPTFE